MSRRCTWSIPACMGMAARGICTCTEGENTSSEATRLRRLLRRVWDIPEVRTAILDSRHDGGLGTLWMDISEELGGSP